MALVETKNVKYVEAAFGQLVIGPPGSGKTTYCEKVAEFLKKCGRKVAVVNLDPGNENMKYKAEVDVMQLITVEDVMNHCNMGPNGALMYCMEYLETNFGWLFDKLKKSSHKYFIFDCPGQVELYTHHKSMRNVFTKLQELDFHLCTVNLIDSHYCSEPTKFISTLMLSLNTMLQMELPHVNVLSKADLLKKYNPKLLFNIDFYTEVLDLDYLIEAIEGDPSMKKYHKLNAAIVSLVGGYNLVTYQLLDVNKDDSLVRLKNSIDKANGFYFGVGEQMNVNSLMACAMGAENECTRSSKDIDPYVE